MGTTKFFDDDGMDFATRCVLSGVRHGMAEVGEVLVATESIHDGDPASWLGTYVTLGRRLRSEAEDTARAGHRYSAWNAALRAANYLFAGLWWAPAAGIESDALWEEHRGAWDLAVDHWPSPAMPVRVPYAEMTLPGYWFLSPSESPAASTAAPRARPVVLLVQGLNTPLSDATMTGLDGALARGYHVLLIEGPGQGAALRRQGLTLATDWSTDWTLVIESALEWLGARPEVDPDRVVLMGVNHGSFFATAAMTGTHRLRESHDVAESHTPAQHAPPVAALVLDPGVVDLGVDARAAAEAARGDAMQTALLGGTTTDPTGTGTLAEALERLDAMVLDTVDLTDISVPTLVVESEDASGFRGQGATLLGTLPAAQSLRLTHSQGAGADCGLDASQIHDAAVFDWLDDLLTPDTRSTR